MKFSSGSFSRTKIVSPTAARSVRPAFFAKGFSGFSMTCWLEARSPKTRTMGIDKKAVFLVADVFFLKLIILEFKPF